MTDASKFPTFPIESLGFAFGLVGEINRRLYARAIEPLGITDQQLFILTMLERLGPQVQAHLSEPLKISKAAMVGLINDLERKELVQRLQHPTDRRAVLVHLTEPGRLKTQQGYELSDQFTQRFFQGVTEEEQQQLRNILKRLFANANTLAEVLDIKNRDIDL